MVDNIEPLSALVVLTLIVAVWLGIGIRERHVTRRNILRFRWAVKRFDAVASEGRCARIWIDRNHYHVCTLRYEHDGPHCDQIMEAIER